MRLRPEIVMPPSALRTTMATLGQVLAAIAIVVTIAVVASSAGRRHGFGESKVDIARATVKKYAYEAYPSWADAHPDRACPDSLLDLNDYMNNKDTRDPWGGDYEMICGAGLPRGAKGIAVESPGEDGRQGTADDIKSWE